MKLNRRFNVFGTIGNYHELYAVPRTEPTHSYHIRERANREAPSEEIAIRYDREAAIDAAASRSAKNPDVIVTVHRKAIFKQEAQQS